LSPAPRPVCSSSGDEKDGGQRPRRHLLKTDRQDLADDEIWQLYILLTRVEAAFRAMKSP